MYEEQYMADFLRDAKLFYLGPTRDDTGRITKEFAEDVWRWWKPISNIRPIDTTNLRDDIKWDDGTPSYVLKRETWTTLRYSFDSRTGVKAAARRAYEACTMDLVRIVRTGAEKNPDNTYFVEGPDLYMKRDALYYEMFGWLHLFVLNPKAA